MAFWREHAQLVDMLRPENGSSVVVSGTVTGVEKFDGQNGESLSVQVSGDGLRVFPKRDQGRGGGYQQSQQGGFQQTPQGQQQAPQQGSWGSGGDWGAPQQHEVPF